MSGRGGIQKRCEEIRAHLIDAVMGPGDFNLDSLDPEIKAHLRGCEECEAFLDDVVRLKQAANEAYASSEVQVEVRPGEAAQAVQAAVGEGLARRAAAEAGRRGANLLERALFLLFAAGVLAVQALLFRHMRIAWFLALEAGLNYLAPLVFYCIVALFWRPAAHRREGVR